MTTSLLLLTLGAGAGTVVGFGVYRVLKSRACYFAEFRRFLDYLISDLKYRRTDVVTLREGFTSADKDFGKNLDEWVAALATGEKKLSRGYLKKAELHDVETILFAIGSVDLDAQLFELEAAKERVGGYCTATEAAFGKYGTLSVKLGLSAGLVLGILFM